MFVAGRPCADAAKLYALNRGAAQAGGCEIILKDLAAFAGKLRVQDFFKKLAGRAKQGKSGGRCHGIGQYVPACITGKLKKCNGPNRPLGHGVF